MSDELYDGPCVAGCQHYHGGEVRHHSSCGHYSDSLTKVFEARIEALETERDEAYRRRDEWRKKAEGYDAVRLALREKVGTPWPAHMSRVLWAGIAADEKKRADDAEAENARMREALKRVSAPEAFYVATSNVDPEAYARMVYAQAVLDGLILERAQQKAEFEVRQRYDRPTLATKGGE